MYAEPSCGTFDSPAWSLSARSVTIGMKLFRSAPTQYTSPTPVRMATHASSSSRKRTHASASWPKCSRSRAFRRSGRSIVIVTMRPRFS